MKVKRAAQVFNNTVQAEMMTDICSGHLPQEVYNTAAFVEKYVHSLFELNQDPLENCFSFIRAKGGFSANPDPKQFADAYKQMLIKSCISQPGLRCLAHPVSNVQMILLSLPLMMPWVSLNLQP